MYMLDKLMYLIYNKCDTEIWSRIKTWLMPCFGATFLFMKGVFVLAYILNFFQSESVLLKGELLLRIIIAVFCGAFIGYERTNRGKGAGIRTHTIVAVASCLMMIISQYGFEDFFNTFTKPDVDIKLDPSRIAAQIVTGIGFLGAGMIFIQKNNITGLTTAAGIWTVAGIGMSIGCGMYFIGIACTIIIFLVQLLMHKNSRFLHNMIEGELVINVEESEDAIVKIIELLKEFEINIIEISYKKHTDNLIEVKILVQYTHNINKGKLIEDLYKQENIRLAKV